MRCIILDLLPKEFKFLGIFLLKRKLAEDYLLHLFIAAIHEVKGF